jgi:hypothetical protein
VSRVNSFVDMHGVNGVKLVSMSYRRTYTPPPEDTREYEHKKENLECFCHFQLFFLVSRVIGKGLCVCVCAMWCV